MSPRSTAREVGHHMNLGANRFGDGFSGQTSCEVQAPNLSYLGLFKRLIVKGLSFRLRVKSPVMAVAGRHRGPSALDSIRNVVLGRSPAEVFRIAARRIVAGVQGVWQAYGRWSILQEARHPRGDVFYTACPAVGDCEKAVPLPMFRASCPQPALILPSAVNFCPEPSLVFVCHVYHDDDVA